MPATDLISAERKFTEVDVFAFKLAELAAPPTIRHQAKTSSTMIADLTLLHAQASRELTGPRSICVVPCAHKSLAATRRVQLKRTRCGENGFIKGKKRFQTCFVDRHGAVTSSLASRGGPPFLRRTGSWLGLSSSQFGPNSDNRPARVPIWRHPDSERFRSAPRTG